jgi:hypothetical protein
VQACGYLEWNIHDLASAMRIEEADVHEYFTDGRRVSFVIERRIAYEVLKGTLAPSEGASYDVLDAQRKKWGVRSISKNVYFCPSYMVGSGRLFEKDGFEKKLTEVAGYILADITRFPLMPYWIVHIDVVREWWKTGRLGPSTHISRSKALSLLNEVGNGRAIQPVQERA